MQSKLSRLLYASLYFLPPQIVNTRPINLPIVVNCLLSVLLFNLVEWKPHTLELASDLKHEGSHRSSVLLFLVEISFGRKTYNYHHTSDSHAGGVDSLLMRLKVQFALTKPSQRSTLRSQ